MKNTFSFKWVSLIPTGSFEPSSTSLLNSSHLKYSYHFRSLSSSCPVDHKTFSQSTTSNLFCNDCPVLVSFRYPPKAYFGLSWACLTCNDEYHFELKCSYFWWMTVQFLLPLRCWYFQRAKTFFGIYHLWFLSLLSWTFWESWKFLIQCHCPWFSLKVFGYF